MTDAEKAKLVELEGLTLAHTALFAAIMGVLKGRQGLTPADLNAVFDNALLGVEHGQAADEVSRGARRFLETLAASPHTKG